MILELHVIATKLVVLCFLQSTTADLMVLQSLPRRSSHTRSIPPARPSRRSASQADTPVFGCRTVKARRGPRKATSCRVADAIVAADFSRCGEKGRGEPAPQLVMTPQARCGIWIGDHRAYGSSRFGSCQDPRWLRRCGSPVVFACWGQRRSGLGGGGRVMQQ